MCHRETGYQLFSIASLIKETHLSYKDHAMITGTGVAIPSRVLTNKDFEAMVDTSDEWIRERTGIEKRHIIEEGRYTSDLCAEAAMKALEDAGLSPLDVDMICLATVTGDMGFPSTACIVQE